MTEKTKDPRLALLDKAMEMELETYADAQFETYIAIANTLGALKDTITSDMPLDPDQLEKLAGLTIRYVDQMCNQSLQPEQESTPESTDLAQRIENATSLLAFYEEWSGSNKSTECVEHCQAAIKSANEQVSRGA